MLGLKIQDDIWFSFHVIIIVIFWLRFDVASEILVFRIAGVG
jgi:hypothetical protein